MVLGDKQQILYGKGYIEDVLCGKTFRISPKSFYQVNPIQTEVLYNKAIEFAGLTEKKELLMRTVELAQLEWSQVITQEKSFL